MASWGESLLPHRYSSTQHRRLLRSNGTRRHTMPRPELKLMPLISALYEDSCLFVVPGSHSQPRTPEQRLLSSTQEPPKDPMDMPGAIRVTLKRTSPLLPSPIFKHPKPTPSRRNGILQQQHPSLRDLRPHLHSRYPTRLHG